MHFENLSLKTRETQKLNLRGFSAFKYALSFIRLTTFPPKSMKH